MQMVKSQGAGYHHTFAVLYDVAGLCSMCYLKTPQWP